MGGGCLSTGNSPARTPDAAALDVTVATTQPLSLSVHERWQAQGEAREPAVRGKLAIVEPDLARAAGTIPPPNALALASVIDLGLF